MNNYELFDSLHRQTVPLTLPNAWDAASAKTIEQAGAKAIATSSAAVAWSLGFADGNHLTAKLNIEAALRIARVISVPLSVDLENGYSNSPEIVAENIKPLLEAGIAGINIEDGRDSPEILAEKIAAIRAVAGSDLYINARTDVYLAALVSPEERVEETIRRAKLYTEAGASGLFVPVVIDTEQVMIIAENTALPLNVLALPGLAKSADLGRIGVKRLSAGTGVAQTALSAAYEAARSFLTEGDADSFGSANPVNLQALFRHD